MSEFRGRTVIITGGAGGIGMACARLFLGAGALVHLADIDGERLAQAQAECAPLGRVSTTGAVMAMLCCAALPPKM